MTEMATSSASGGEILVTVLVTTRNADAHIRGCLSGLARQSIRDRMEVIVIDQGSEQCEWAVVADLQRSCDSLISLRVPAAGAASAVELGVAMASGKYLTLLNATDRMRDDAYELLAMALEGRPEAVLAYGDTCRTTVANESFTGRTAGTGQVWPDYSLSQPPAAGQIPPHLLWRRELHQTVGPFRDAGEFLRRVVQRFTVVHLREFLGLQYVTLPSDPDQALAQLAPLIEGDDPQQVIRVLERHLSDFPGHALAHNNLAALCYRAGDKEKALTHYRQAVQLAPSEETYRKNLADLLYAERIDVDEAIFIYLEVLKGSPRDTETLLNLGIICEEVGQHVEAETFLERALELEPWNEAARERLTQLRQQVSQPEAAPAREESAEELYQQAQALVAEGDADGAVRELERLIRLYPDFPTAHNDLGVLNYQKGAKEKALEHYEKAAALAPENSIFQKNLADFYFVETGNVDGAIAIYLDQLRKEPTDVETLMNLGKICVMLDRPREAEAFYDKVTRIEPWNMSARESLNNLRNCASM